MIVSGTKDVKSECIFHHGFKELRKILYVGVGQGDSKPEAEELEGGTLVGRVGPLKVPPEDTGHLHARLFQRIRGEIAFYFSFIDLRIDYVFSMIFEVLFQLHDLQD